MWMSVHLMLSQRSFKLCSFFTLFCYTVVISTTLSSCSLIDSSASFILQFISSSVFFTSIITLFISVYLFFEFFELFVHHFFYLLSLCLYSFPEILDHLYCLSLNYFSYRLPNCTTLSCSCSFIWNIYLFHLILSNFLYLWSHKL